MSVVFQTALPRILFGGGFSDLVNGVSPRLLTLIGFIGNISHSGKGLLAAHSATQCKIPVGAPGLKHSAH